MTDDLEIIATLPPLHSGEVLREEYLVALGLSAGAVAKACGVPRTRIERIMREEMGVTADTALRLGRYFRTSPDLWLNLQQRFELETARAAVGAEVDRAHQARHHFGDLLGDIQLSLHLRHKAGNPVGAIGILQVIESAAIGHRAHQGRKL